jgi:hypothetical protein
MTLTDLPRFPCEPYTNDTSQRERKETLRNDQRTSTFFDQSKISAALEEGRKALANIHTGSEKFVAYPPQPDTSPWSGPQPGPEPPLGYSVEDQIPVGEAFEVQRSLAAQSANDGITPPSEAGGSVPVIVRAGDASALSSTPLTPASGDAAAPAIQQSAHIPLSSAGAIHSAQPTIKRRRF